jgi:SAM-dependent methyltransferase
MNDKRLFAPSTARNRQPILDVLRNILPAQGLALEIASGAGEHVTFFAEHLPQLTFHPSDPSAEARESIAAWIAARGAGNVLAPLALDVEALPWPVGAADAIICINMIHISPWSATQALFEGAGRALPAGAPLYLYGPYRRGGAHTAHSNAEFDASLRARNPEWGIRDLDEVAEVAREKGFGEPQVVEMPANNLSVVFRRR